MHTSNDHTEGKSSLPVSDRRSSHTLYFVYRSHCVRRGHRTCASFRPRSATCMFNEIHLRGRCGRHSSRHEGWG
eukprot:30659-Eustigmatos_ZCMA.PRE.1